MLVDVKNWEVLNTKALNDLPPPQSSPRLFFSDKRRQVHLLTTDNDIDRSNSFIVTWSLYQLHYLQTPNPRWTQIAKISSYIKRGPWTAKVINVLYFLFGAAF